MILDSIENAREVALTAEVGSMYDCFPSEEVRETSVEPVEGKKLTPVSVIFPVFIEVAEMLVMFAPLLRALYVNLQAPVHLLKTTNLVDITTSTDVPGV